MPYEAILFDLDGTLLNTLDGIGNTVNRILASRGFPIHAIDAYRYFVGEGLTLLISRALPEDQRDPMTVQACVEAYRENYNRTFSAVTKPYPGVPAMLDALTARGLKLAILSNKPHRLTMKSVIELLPNWTFEVILGQRAEVPRKPDPAGAYEIAERLGIPPAHFLYLGDTAVDMQTAIAAGMFPIGVLWGFRSAEELQVGGAQALIEHPLDSLKFLDSS